LGFRRARPTTAGIWSSAAISRGIIFIASKDGVLRTFAPATGWRIGPYGASLASPVRR